jgi:iron(III) transport system ATP-binding protein
MERVKVEARHIELSYGATPVLRDVSVTVEPGEFFALLGPSGSGKSTLLRLIAGFATAQRGEIVIGGRDVSGVPPWKRNVGMVFQNYALWPHMTVARNVAFGLEERRVPRDEVRRKVAEALALVGLEGYGERRPGQLSGGQQQRVALARTLAVEPQVLLLDEPLSNLDAKLRLQMRRELRRMHEKLGITTIFVTHDQEEALTMCDRIAVMDQGVVQQVGTPLELFDAPANRFVAEFVGTVNIVHTPRGEVAFRPHAVEIDAPAAGDGLQLEGVIAGTEFLGEFVRYDVNVDGGSRVIADQPHRRGRAPLANGARVRLAVPEREIRIIGNQEARP